MWLPPNEVQRREEVMREHANDVASQVETAAFLRTWTRELKQLDPYLELVKAREDSTLPELKPGFYHVLRHNPGTQPLVIPVEGPNGEFKEPDSSLYEMLKRLDVWSGRTRRELKRLQQKMDRQRESRKRHERAERLEETMDRLHALNDPGVSFAATGRPWTARAGARRG